jgi:hypothetical protein
MAREPALTGVGARNVARRLQRSGHNTYASIGVA